MYIGTYRYIFFLWGRGGVKKMCHWERELGLTNEKSKAEKKLMNADLPWRLPGT
jgi:hypothetical protein